MAGDVLERERKRKKEIERNAEEEGSKTSRERQRKVSKKERGSRKEGRYRIGRKKAICAMLERVGRGAVLLFTPYRARNVTCNILEPLRVSRASEYRILGQKLSSFRRVVIQCTFLKRSYNAREWKAPIAQ